MSDIIIPEITFQVYKTLYDLNSRRPQPDIQVLLVESVLIFTSSSTKAVDDALPYRDERLESKLKDNLRNKIYKLNNRYYISCSDITVERMLSDHYQVKVPIKMVEYSSYLNFIPKELQHIVFIKSKLKIDEDNVEIFGIKSTSVISYKQLFILAFPDIYQSLISYDKIGVSDVLPSMWMMMYNRIIKYEIILSQRRYGKRMPDAQTMILELYYSITT